MVTKIRLEYGTVAYLVANFVADLLVIFFPAKSHGIKSDEFA